MVRIQNQILKSSHSTLCFLKDVAEHQVQLFILPTAMETSSADGQIEFPKWGTEREPNAETTAASSRKKGISWMWG